MGVKLWHGFGCYTTPGPCLSIEKEGQEDDLGLEKQEDGKMEEVLEKTIVRFKGHLSAG